MEVYIEYAIIDNFVMDFLLIKATLKVTRNSVVLWRILLASFFGTAVAVLLPLANFHKALSFIIKLLTGIQLIFIAGKYENAYKGIMAVNVFVLFTFLTGGLMIALFNFAGIDYLDSGVWSYNTAVPMGVNFLIGYFATKLIAAVVDKIYKKRDLFPFIKNCEITYKDNTVKIKGYVDSGNRLYDNLTLLPITVVSKETFLSLTLGDVSKENKMRYVRFSTVSGEDKMKIFVADKLSINDGGVKIEVKNPIIAISNTKFKDDGEYSALLHPSYF